MLRIVIYASLLLMADGSIQPHDPGNNAVDLLRALFLAGFDVLRCIDLCDHVACHPAEHGIAAVDDLSLKQQLVQFFHAWTHILKTHADGNHGEAVAFQVGDQLCRIPAVNADLTDVVLFPQLIN